MIQKLRIIKKVCVEEISERFLLNSRKGTWDTNQVFVPLYTNCTQNIVIKFTKSR